MPPAVFVYASVALNLVSGGRYLRAALRGEAHPDRVTWFFWAILPFIAGAGQLGEGVGFSTLAVFSFALMPDAIFFVALFDKRAYWRLGALDYACGAGAAAGLLLWALTQNAEYAIAFAVASDFFAAVPTIVKAYAHPESEDGPAFALGTSAALAGFLAVRQPTFAAYAFITYALLVNAAIALLIYRKRLFGR